MTELRAIGRGAWCKSNAGSSAARKQAWLYGGPCNSSKQPSRFGTFAPFHPRKLRAGAGSFAVVCRASTADPPTARACTHRQGVARRGSYLERFGRSSWSACRRARGGRSRTAERRRSGLAGRHRTRQACSRRGLQLHRCRSAVTSPCIRGCDCLTGSPEAALRGCAVAEGFMRTGTWYGKNHVRSARWSFTDGRS